MLRDVAERVARGENDADIGKAYGVSRKGIWTIRKYHGVQRCRRPVLDALAAKGVMLRYESGESCEAIARDCGVSDRSVRRYIAMERGK